MKSGMRSNLEMYQAPASRPAVSAQLIGSPIARSGCQSDFQYRVCSEECTNSLIEIVVEADATRATAAEIGRLTNTCMKQ